MEMRQHKTTIQSATTEGYSQRPISLTPVLSKCFEQFIFGWITAIAGDQVDPEQFGLVKGTSTVHALIELVHS